LRHFHGAKGDNLTLLDSPVLTFQQQTQCAYWHCKMRGEMTREKYHRLALEMAGLPPKTRPPAPASESPGGGSVGNSRHKPKN
jgi:hypothetical protein